MIFAIRLIAAIALGAAATLAEDDTGAKIPGSPIPIERAWHDLDSEDNSIRTAARVRVEAEPWDQLKSKALEETRPWASIEALVALCHACPAAEGPALRPHICESITTLRIEQMSPDQKLGAVRLTRLVCTRFGAPTEDERQQMLDLWSRFLADPGPGRSVESDRMKNEIKELIAFLSETGK